MPKSKHDDDLMLRRVIAIPRDRSLVVIITVTLLVGTGFAATAACVSRRCGAEHASVVETLRTELQIACDCRGRTEHGKYTRCVQATLRKALREGRVSKACARNIQHCEDRSTCGRTEAVVCCRMKRGKAKATIARSAAQCRRGSACTGFSSAFDACTSDALCVPEPCLASVERAPSNVPPDSLLSVVDRMEIRAITESGCGPLEGPLVALNWFTVRDREAFERYAPIATSVLIEHGHRTILESHRVETFEAPPGTPSTGGAYVHEELVLARYRSAGSFLDMILSPEFVTLLPDQQAASRQDDYVWGLERCFVGCASEGPTFTDGRFVAHIFRYEGDDLESAIRALAGENATPEMIYAGELVAVLRVLIGDVNANLQSRPWGQGAMVFRVSSREDALRWLSDPTFLQFRAQTAEDVIVLLQAGA